MKQTGIRIVAGISLFLIGLIVGNIDSRRPRDGKEWRVGDEVSIVMPTGEFTMDNSPTDGPVQVPTMRRKTFTIVAPITVTRSKEPVWTISFDPDGKRDLRLLENQ